MANKVLHGPYGWYYQYIDANGKKRNLSIFDEVYTNYLSKGYLTEAHLEAIVTGKTISFKIPKKSGNGEITVTAKLIPYTRKDGKETKIIDFQTDQADDLAIVKAKGEAIVTSYWDGNRFSYNKPLQFIDTLDLEQQWKTWSQDRSLNNGIRVGTVKCYRPKVRQDEGITFYCKVENGKCEQISEEQYKTLIAAHDEQEKKEQEEYRKNYDGMMAVRNDALKWLNGIIDKIWPGGAKPTTAQLIANAEPVVANVNVPNLEDRIAGMMNSTTMYKTNMSSYFENARTEIKTKITTKNYTETGVVDDIKNRLLNNIKSYIEYAKVKQFRADLYQKYQSMGLDVLTFPVDIDSALSLGYFPTVQKILVKYKADAPKYIINNMYPEIIDTNVLETHLLNMLKIYYDFYDMPEKDRKAIAKFVAQNRINDYYEAVSKFDDVLEILIDNSRDPRLTKPLLEGIAGTAKANVLKDKTYYFEKRGRLRGNIILYKPVELVEELRKHIKEFNVSSGVAILTNIELDADESFIFQFYTFAEGEGDEKGFDGRRMLNLTRIYNRSHPNAKIGFYFDNESEDSDEDDE